MPQLAVQRRSIIAAGHHRRPRSTSAATAPQDVETYGMAAGGPIDRHAGSEPGERFLFWSVTDQTSVSFTQANDHLVSTMPGYDTVATRWYMPLPGSPGGPGEPGYIVDAFSELIGDFIDDDFVDVSPDVALTADANVVGWVPTTNQETLTARATVQNGGTLPFGQWIGDGNIAADTDSLDRASSGYALATYKAPAQVVVNRPSRQFELYVKILIGIIEDGPGWVLGPDGPHPVDPGWGALQAVATSVLVESLTANTKNGPEIARLAMHDVNMRIQALNEARDARLEQGGLETR